ETLHEGEHHDQQRHDQDEADRRQRGRLPADQQVARVVPNRYHDTPLPLSFPGSAWERTAREAPPPEAVLTRATPLVARARQSLASIAFPGRAWERGCYATRANTSETLILQAFHAGTKPPKRAVAAP